MVRSVLVISMLASVSTFCGAAVAGSPLIGATYIGDRAPDPEDETFAYVVNTEGSGHPLAFIGPARNFGPVTGDAEKDTVGYLPLLAVHKDGLWSFVFGSEW